MRSELIHKIFNGYGAMDDAFVLEVYRFQYEYNEVYRRFCDNIGRYPDAVETVYDIPFLPVAFFKTHKIQTGFFEPETYFESSGTTGSVNSRHLVRSLDLYRESFTRGFRHFYGAPADWCIIGLLPAYLERQHSSLVVMVNELINLSGHPQSGFYLYDLDRLKKTLADLQETGQKVLLLGVTFALLDFAEQYPGDLKGVTIMETGGMKGRRKELTRQELHQVLGKAFGYPPIHSEYGMTELLSQAYARANGIFHCPPWMRILLREEDDPLTINNLEDSKGNGLINIIDLANIDSSCFIATDDIGRLRPDGGFEVIGRRDNSDIRGCSLLFF